MLALLPDDHKPCFFLRGGFLKRVPADTGAHLLREDFSNPIFLAHKADKIYQSRVSSSLAFDVSNTSDEQFQTNPIKPLSYSSQPCHSATPHASNQHESLSQSPTLCYYHRSLGSQAKKCRAPCSWLRN